MIRLFTVLVLLAGCRSDDGEETGDTGPEWTIYQERADCEEGYWLVPDTAYFAWATECGSPDGSVEDADRDCGDLGADYLGRSRSPSYPGQVGLSARCDSGENDLGLDVGIWSTEEPVQGIPSDW